MAAAGVLASSGLLRLPSAGDEGRAEEAGRVQAWVLLQALLANDADEQVRDAARAAAAAAIDDWVCVWRQQSSSRGGGGDGRVEDTAPSSPAHRQLLRELARLHLLAPMASDTEPLQQPLLLPSATLLCDEACAGLVVCLLCACWPPSLASNLLLPALEGPIAAGLQTLEQLGSPLSPTSVEEAAPEAGAADGGGGGAVWLQVPFSRRQLFLPDRDSAFAEPAPAATAAAENLLTLVDDATSCAAGEGSCVSIAGVPAARVRLLLDSAAALRRRLEVCVQLCGAGRSAVLAEEVAVGSLEAIPQLYAACAAAKAAVTVLTLRP